VSFRAPGAEYVTTFESSGLGASFKLSRRWNGTVNLTDAYGDEVAHMLSSLSSAGANGWGLPMPSAFAFQQFPGNVLTVGGRSDLSWQRTRQQALWFALSGGYMAYLQQQRRQGRGGEAAMGLAQHIAPAVTLGSYARVSHSFNSECTVYGMGGGVGYTINSKTMIEGGAGPEYGSRNCGRRLGVYFSGMLRRELTGRSSMIVEAHRDLNTYYLIGSRWADVVSGWLEVRTSPRTQFELRGGYLHSARADQPGTLYSGYFVAPQLRWLMAPNWDILVGYRRCQSDQEFAGVALPSLQRDVILLSLEWRPQPLKTRY